MNEVLNRLRQIWKKEKVEWKKDPNSADVLYLGLLVTEYCCGDIGQFHLKVEQSKKILKIVGDYLLDENIVAKRQSSTRIRLRSDEQLIKELEELERLIDQSGVPIGKGKLVLSRALSLYGSYLSISKETRSKDAHGESINPKNAKQNYDTICEYAKTNDWIRAGIVLSRILRPNGDSTVTDWIPNGSIYWQEL